MTVIIHWNYMFTIILKLGKYMINMITICVYISYN